MKKEKILLLDLNPQSDLGKNLKLILESSHEPDIRLMYESVEVLEPSLYGNALSNVISHFHPDIIFLVLSPDNLKQAGALFQSVGRELSALPIIAVIEGSKPADVIELLEIGIVDFVTLPLKAIDIIPRLWRLRERKHRSDTLYMFFVFGRSDVREVDYWLRDGKVKVTIRIIPSIERALPERTVVSFYEWVPSFR